MKIPLPQDLGFGSKLNHSGGRLINKDGSFNITRQGKDSFNIYQSFINMSGWQFAGVMLLLFLGINLFFAWAFFYIGVEQLQGVPQGDSLSSFLYCFFFSIQTFTTVGYGGINPVGIPANFISSLCAAVGLIIFALVTGLFFARFSRPKLHIAFSKCAIIAPYQDITSLQCRIVHTRKHKMIDVSATITMTWLEEAEGSYKRRFARLPLERDKVVLLPLNWTIVHPIDAESPLYGKDVAYLKKIKAEFLVMISAFDENYNQMIHANSSYLYDEINEGVRFAPMYKDTMDRETILMLDQLSAVSPV